MEVEVQSWPYDFPQSEDFPSSDERGNIFGRLLISDRYLLLITVYSSPLFFAVRIFTNQLLSELLQSRLRKVEMEAAPIGMYY